MQTTIINPTNAERATEFLLLLDTTAVTDEHRPHALGYFDTMKQALTSYQLLLQKSYLVIFGQQTRMKLIQKNLEVLLRYARRFSQILIPEAQDKLISYLSDSSAPRQFVKMYFKKEQEALAA